MTKVFSTLAAFIFTASMAQASFMGTWTAELPFTNSNGGSGTYMIQQDYSLVNDVFTYTQSADDYPWITIDFNVVNGTELFLNGVAVGTISDTEFSFTNFEIEPGVYYDASMVVNADGTGSFKDKIHSDEGWEQIDGVLNFVPPTIEPQQPAVP